MLRFALCGIWIATTIAAVIAIYVRNLHIVKQKCQSWDGTKLFLFSTKIRDLHDKIPSWQVSQDRDKLLASEDYQLILRQARRTWVEMFVAMLGIFAVFVVFIGMVK